MTEGLKSCLVFKFLAFGMIAACTRSHEKDSHGIEMRYFILPGGPHPLACTIDAECVAGPFVDPDNGCCDSGLALGVFGRRYIERRAAWIGKNCANVSCPLMPPPTRPPDCALQGLCVAGMCRGNCERVSDAAPEWTVLPTDAARSVGLMDAPGYWSPLPEDIATAERLLAACLPALAPSPAYQADKLTVIIAALGEYRRQYVPFRDEQSRRNLWVNLLRDRVGRHPMWRTELVHVRGGGHDYASVILNTDTGSCKDLKINSSR